MVNYNKALLVRFIKDNKQLILDHDFDELYAKAFYNGMRTQELTQLIVDCGINPLKYVTYLVTDMFYTVDLPEKFENLKIPDGIEHIDEWRFGRCYGLKSVDLNTVSSIGTNAFSWSDIELINLETVKYIGQRAFFGCLGLESINLKSATYVGIEAFYECARLKTVYAPKDLDLSKAGLPEDCEIIRG